MVSLGESVLDDMTARFFQRVELKTYHGYELAKDDLIDTGDRMTIELRIASQSVITPEYSVLDAKKQLLEHIRYGIYGEYINQLQELEFALRGCIENQNINGAREQIESLTKIISSMRSPR